MLCTCLPGYSACYQPRPCPLCLIFSSTLKGHSRTSWKSSKAFPSIFLLSSLPHTLFETSLIRSSWQLDFVNLLMWYWCICLAKQMQYLLIVPQEKVDHIFYCMSPCEKSHCCRSCLCTEKSPGWKKKLTSSIPKSVMFRLWISVLQIFILLNISLDSLATCNTVTQPPPLIDLRCWVF